MNRSTDILANLIQAIPFQSSSLQGWPAGTGTVRRIIDNEGCIVGKVAPKHIDQGIYANIDLIRDRVIPDMEIDLVGGPPDDERGQ
jgi:hypothetical protein